MGYYASLQLFKPPGITSDAATPNFLRDLSLSTYQGQWTLMTQGGLATAQFDCRQLYGDIVDIVFGTYVLWGLFGAKLNAPASSGQSFVSVTNLLNEGWPAGSTFQDLQTGDVVMLTDGTNTELFSVTSITGSNPIWTVNLTTPGGKMLGLPSVLKNNYAAGAIIVRLQFQGFVSQRVRSTAFDEQFSVNISGFFNRYSQFLATANLQGADAGQWLYYHCSSIASQPELSKNTGGGGPNWPIGTLTFTCNDLSALLVGEQITISKNTANAENFTIDSINPPNGTFTVHVASTKVHNQGDIVCPVGLQTAPYLPDIVIDPDLLPHPNNIKVNLQASDQPFSELIAAVVRQETGASKTKTYTCYVDALRQLQHKQISSVPPNIAETKMTIDAPPGSSTFHVANLAQIKVGRRVFITGAAGVDSLKVSAVHPAFNSFDTTGSSTYDHPVGDKVVCIYDVTPSYSLTQGDNGSGVGDTINKIQMTDMDGTQLMNAVISTGTVISPNGQIQSELTSAVQGELDSPPGSTSFSVADDQFVNGDTVTIIAKGGVNTENVVITGDPTGSGPYTYPCTQIQHNHAAGQPVVLASGSGSGPRIIMFEGDSTARFGFFEGQLSSADITDRQALVTWTKQQLELVAWPTMSAAIDFDTASGRMSALDLLGITGFSDGVPLYINATEIQYQWLALTRNVTASTTAGSLKSTAGSVLKELANRHAIRDHNKNPRKRPHNGDGHVAGGEIIPNGDNTFALNAVTVKSGTAVYQVAAISSQAAPEGVSFWGVDLSNPASPVFDVLPSVVWNGRAVYAEAIYSATDDDGVAPTLISSFTGVPLWKVEVRDSVIVGVWPLFATDGAGLSQLPSSSAPPTPTFSTSVPSAAAIGNGIGVDLTLATAFTNVPQDDTTHSIKYYTRTNGTTTWSHKFTRKIPGLPQPATTSLSDTVVFQNLAASGSSVDIGASFESLNGESTIVVLVTGYTIPGQGPSSATETTQAVVTTATRILTTNANRQAVVIYNAANSTLFVGTDNSTTPTHFMDEIGPRERWMLPVAYTGEIWVCWAAADGAAGAQANIAAFPS